MITTETGLADRAQAAAEQYRTRNAATFHRRHHDWAQWTRRATVARTIATALDVGPERVTVTDDPDRHYGLSRQIASDLITVTCPATGTRWRFIPDLHTAGQGWLLLENCPECDRPVPVVRVATLADLGHHLDLDGDPFTGMPIEFYDDPAHRTGCPAAP